MMGEPGEATGPSMSFEGMNALVTGGTSGIGADIARRIAGAGASVAAVGRRTPTTDERTRATLHTIQADLADPSGCAVVAARTATLFDHLDVLVHAAGIFRPGPFADTTLEDLNDTLSVNLIAPFRLTQELLPLLREGSSIVFVSSVAGHVGLTGEAAYSASKAGIEGLTRALSVELASRRIRVNAIAPGFTATPMNESFRANETIVTRAVDATLARRLAEPADIAKAAVFLASAEASFIWGTVLPVDGGYPMSDVQLAREW